MIRCILTGTGIVFICLNLRLPFPCLTCPYTLKSLAASYCSLLLLLLFFLCSHDVIPFSLAFNAESDHRRHRYTPKSDYQESSFSGC